MLSSTIAIVGNTEYFYVGEQIYVHVADVVQT